MPLPEHYDRDQTLCLLHPLSANISQQPWPFHSPHSWLLQFWEESWSGAGSLLTKDGALKSVLPKALQGIQTSVQLNTTSSSSHTVSVGAELAIYAYCHSP